MAETLTIGLAQIAPVWLNKAKTIEKVKSYLSDAGNQKCELVVFGEALLPGYPFWLSFTNGAKFNSTILILLFKKKFMHIIYNKLLLLKMANWMKFAN